MLWRAELLGGLRLIGNDERIYTKFYSQKTALLLARLIYPPVRTHGREELIEHLWPESDPVAGRANLRNVLSALRRQLEPKGTPPGTVLYADNHHICLKTEQIETDVACFERLIRKAQRAGGVIEQEETLRTALALYRGDLLPGFYEDWILQERERLCERFANAWNELHRLCVRHGDTAEADDIKQRLLARRGEASAVKLQKNKKPTAPAALVSLPRYFTRFIGREQEKAELQTLLTENPLVTITGTGGVGKTRLATEVAREWADPGRVAFVALESVSQAAQIPERVLTALSLPLTTENNFESLSNALRKILEKRSVLLILDNMEQLRHDGASFVSALLSLPGLRLIVTSRYALQLAEEREYPLAPLPVPSSRLTEPEALLTCDSVKLLVERAQSVRPDYEVNARNAAAIAAICHQLEGLPLSLEIAGVRALVTTPWQMRAELEHRLDFLTQQARTGQATPERHRSLRSAIEWSYSLLSPETAVFLARSSVFCNGFTQETARLVCDTPHPLSHIEELCQASLLQAEEQDDVMRFRFLETIRSFALEKLRGNVSEETEQRTRHTRFFADIAEAAFDKMDGKEQVQLLNALTADHDNLRTMLDVATPLEQLRACAGLWRFWLQRGYIREGITRCQTALERFGTPENREEQRLRARVCSGLASLLLPITEYEAADKLFTEARLAYEQAGDERAVWMLANLGVTALYRGDYVRARQFSGQCILESPDPNDPRLGSVHLNYGLSALYQNDFSTAEASLQTAMRLYNTIGNVRGLAKVHNGLGATALEQGQNQVAFLHFEKGLHLHRELRDREGCSVCLYGMAGAKLEMRHVRDAAVHFGAAQSLNQQIQVPVKAIDREKTEKTWQEIQAHLDVESLRIALTEGAAMFADWADA